MDLQSAGLQSS
jgi:hypothetical protein